MIVCVRHERSVTTTRPADPDACIVFLRFRRRLTASITSYKTNVKDSLEIVWD